MIPYADRFGDMNHIVLEQIAANIFPIMKAAVYIRSKPGKILEIQDLDQPIPRDNEVVLRVHAASVNPLDWRLKMRRPGVDVAGQIVAVGKAVTQFKPGDVVFGAGKGAFAEYACAREDRLTAKPESLSFEQAAAVPIAGLTALQGLRNKGRLQAGQKVLINGASGGVGTFAVQIAKSFGAHVTGICSTKNVELVRSLGADHVIDYTRNAFADDRERYDLLLDNVGNHTLSAMKSVLTANGKIVIVGAPKDFWPAIKGLLRVLVRWPFLRHNIKFFIANINRDDLLTLCQLMQNGKLSSVIDRRYPLHETAAAMAYAEGGHARGKVMINVQ
jgi:NADPH:quinone reductase-like Zn-dependent oxidoreductase